MTSIETIFSAIGSSLLLMTIMVGTTSLGNAYQKIYYSELHKTPSVLYMKK